jgi:hypothetical protein
MRADDDPDAATRPAELLDSDGVGERVQPGPADLLGVRDAEEAEVGGLADDLVRELPLPLELVGDRRDAPIGEVAHRAADLFVLG